MSQTGEAAFERAAALAERERDAGVARIQAKLKAGGRLVCDCGQPISDARREAMPSAQDCIDCATFSDRRNRRVA